MQVLTRICPFKKLSEDLTKIFLNLSDMSQKCPKELPPKPPKNVPKMSPMFPNMSLLLQ